MASDNDKDNFYISGYSESDPYTCHHALPLHRRNTTIMPTGIFHCSISDHIHTMTEHLYVGIYGSMSGGWCIQDALARTLMHACLLTLIGFRQPINCKSYLL